MVFQFDLLGKHAWSNRHRHQLLEEKFACIWYVHLPNSLEVSELYLKTLYQNRSQKTPSINFELTIFMGKCSGLLYILRISSRTHLHNVCLIFTASTLIGVFLQIGNCNKTTVFTHMDTICITLIK